ncbi:MAG: PQQ-binding-like beta-propeller repeat protein [Nanoarchaeota archaeon]
MGLLHALNLKKEGRIVERWQYDCKSHLLCGPSIADLYNDGHESVIIGTKKGTIILLDQNANPKWEYKVAEKIDAVEMMFLDTESVNSILTPPSTFDIDGDGKKEILFGTQLGTLYVLNAEGKLLWKYSTGSAIRGGVACADINNDGKIEIIFGSDDKKLYVLTNKGRVLFTHTIGTGIQSTPTISLRHKAILFGDDDGKFNSLSFDKKLNWSYQTGAKIIGQAWVGKLFGDDQECCVFGSTDNALYVLDMQGSLKWTYKTLGSILSRPAVMDIDNDGMPEVLITSCDNSIYVLSQNGDKIWSYETDFWIGADPLIMDIDDDGNNEVVIGSYDHNIYVFNGEGSYVLEHIPGLSNIIHQAGHYADVQTQDAGENVGKKIWQFGVPDIILGICALKKNIIVGIKTGKIICLSHTR